MIDDKKLNVFLNEDAKENPEKVEKDIKIIRDIKSKYAVEPMDMIAVSMILMKMGYGRNSKTANLLKAISELIECEIETRDSIEARMEGKLQ